MIDGRDDDDDGRSRRRCRENGHRSSRRGRRRRRRRGGNDDDKATSVKAATTTSGGRRYYFPFRAAWCLWTAAIAATTILQFRHSANRLAERYYYYYEATAPDALTRTTTATSTTFSGNSSDGAAAATETAAKNGEAADDDLLGCLAPACVRSLAKSIAVVPYPYRTIDGDGEAGCSWCVRDDDDDDDSAGTNDGKKKKRKKNSRNRASPFRTNRKGILLTKVVKASSSTAASVAVRVARRHDCRLVYWQHSTASSKFRNLTLFSDKKKEIVAVDHETNRRRTFLFGTVRDPSSRALSTIWFHVLSRKHLSPKNNATQTATEVIVDEFGGSNTTSFEDYVIRNLRDLRSRHSGAHSFGQGGFQTRYLSLREILEYSAWSPLEPGQVRNPARIVETVRRIADEDYDFLLSTSRMDESLVVMALIMGIDVGDVLVTSSKVSSTSSSVYHYEKSRKQCVPVLKGEVPSARLRQFLDSDEWRAANYGDFLLEEVAKRKLDLTIELTIGRERFDAAMAEYLRLQQLVKQRCVVVDASSLNHGNGSGTIDESDAVVFPCSSTGEPQLEASSRSCYFPGKDIGCGFRCIDRVLLQSKATS